MEPGAESDGALALRLAEEAGALLVALRQRMAAGGSRDWQVMDAGDAESHRFLMDALATARPGDAVLSEEGRDDPVRLESERVWIVDPLDGTNEYGEYGRVDWAVHVALWERGVLSAGAVSLPAQGVAYGTSEPPAMPLSTRTSPRLVTSRFRSPPAAVIVARALDADALRMGSAGAKAMAVVTGAADVYLHDGGMYEWDSAAPVAVAAATGMHVSRIDGSPLRYNRPDPWLPDLLICRPELAEPVLDALWGNRRPYRDATTA